MYIQHVGGGRLKSLYREREWAAVDEVAVEEVGVVLGGVAERLENVEQVVVLAVRVAAHVDVAPLGHGHVDERGEIL